MGKKEIIQAALDATNLKDCCVINPFPGVNTVNDPRRGLWGDAKSKRNKKDFVGLADLTAASQYLSKGKVLATTELAAEPFAWAGTCATFACASAWIIQNTGLKYTIELFSFGEIYNGHVFLVIDRPADSDEDKPGTWGAQWGGIEPALVVDMWYALQKGRPEEAVFTAPSEYMLWLTSQKKIKCMLRVA